MMAAILVESVLSQNISQTFVVSLFFVCLRCSFLSPGSQWFSMKNYTSTNSKHTRHTHMQDSLTNTQHPCRLPTPPTTEYNKVSNSDKNPTRIATSTDYNTIIQSTPTVSHNTVLIAVFWEYLIKAHSTSHGQPNHCEKTKPIFEHCPQQSVFIFYIPKEGSIHKLNMHPK
jgi:hypothetical protein